MKNNEVWRPITRGGVAVAVAITHAKSLFLELPNQVFVSATCGTPREANFVRPDHLNLEAAHLDLAELVFLSEQRPATK